MPSINFCLLRNERLTQPGTLSVIFSQDSKMEEYQPYLEYLDSESYVEGNPEYLNLEDLQGVYGLRAIRIKIKDDRNRKR